MPTLTYRDALNQALREEMQRDPNVFLIGEEVGVYQGAYKVSRGLLEEFGAKRVVDTPIAELGFAGVGVGAAMTGYARSSSGMTGTSRYWRSTQIINSAAKMCYMSSAPASHPDRVSRPNGAALQLGAQHSQAWEHVSRMCPDSSRHAGHARGRQGTPQIRHPRQQPGMVPKRDSSTTRRRGSDLRAPRPIGSADVKRPGTEVTIVCHSKTVVPALKAAELLAGEHGVSAEVVDLRSLRPLDEHTILASVGKTGRCVVAEEGWPHCGVGAQVVDIIQREASIPRLARLLVTQADVPMQYKISRAGRQRRGKNRRRRAPRAYPMRWHHFFMDSLSPRWRRAASSMARHDGDAVKPATLAESRRKCDHGAGRAGGWRARPITVKDGRRYLSGKR